MYMYIVIKIKLLYMCIVIMIKLLYMYIVIKIKLLYMYIVIKIKLLYMYIVIKIKLLRVKGQLSPKSGQAVATGLLKSDKERIVIHKEMKYRESGLESKGGGVYEAVTDIIPSQYEW